jgi:hypothetical protein
LSVVNNSRVAFSPISSASARCPLAKIVSGSPNALSSLRCVSPPMPGISVRRNQLDKDSVGSMAISANDRQPLKQSQPSL